MKMYQINEKDFKQIILLAEKVGKQKIFNRMANGMFPYQPIAIDTKKALDDAIDERNHYITKAINKDGEIL